MATDILGFPETDEARQRRLKHESYRNRMEEPEIKGLRPPTPHAARDYRNNPVEFAKVNMELITRPKEEGGWGLSGAELVALFPHLGQINNPPVNPSVRPTLLSSSMTQPRPTSNNTQSGRNPPAMTDYWQDTAVNTTDNAVDTGINAADTIQSKKAENNILAGLLSGNPRQSFEPSSGWDRLFKIMARMGATGGVSPLQDFIRGNVALTTQEAASAKEFADRQVKERDLAQRRADQDERMGMERERLDLAKKTFDRSGRPKAPPLNSKTIDAMISVLKTMHGQGQIDYDDLGAGMIGRFFSNKPSADAVQNAIAVGAIEILRLDPEKSYKTAIKEALEFLRTDASGSGSGAASIGAKVNINPEGEIKK